MEVEVVESQVGSKCLVLCSVLSAQCHSATVPQWCFPTYSVNSTVYSALGNPACTVDTTVASYQQPSSENLQRATVSK